MITPNKKDLHTFAEDYNYICVYDTIAYDEMDILALYQQFRGPYSFLMESGPQTYGDTITLIGLPSSTHVQSDGKTTILHEMGNQQVLAGNPLEVIASIVENKNIYDHDLKFFAGGAVGHFNYDMIALYEKINLRNKASLQLPLLHFIITDKLIVVNHDKHIIYFMSIMPTKQYEEAYDQAVADIETMMETYHQITLYQYEEVHTDSNITSTFTKAAYEAAVEKAKAYIQAGDVFQVVLSQRMECGYSQDPYAVFTKLYQENKAEYMFYIDMDEYVVAGASPELLLQARGNQIKTIPIAGTRRRGHNKEEDEVLKEELLHDVKENAEHMMLVDLGRNDIGRVSRFGSVKVQQQRNIQWNTHVMHMTSQVHGTLDEHKSAMDALCSLFPAGTLSGAPKLRAMEIIDELEQVKREIYGGAIGFLAYNGYFDTCITIRTYVFHNHKVYMQAGAGIVKDSVPAKEYEETMQKAGSLLHALQGGAL